MNEVNNYGVKIIFKYKAVSEPDPTLVDQYYDKNIQNYEEIIYLIKAKDFDETFEKAKIQADKHFNDVDLVDGYGRKVVLDSYEIINAFHMFDKRLVNGTELYSNIFNTTNRKLNNILDEMYSLEEE